MTTETKGRFYVSLLDKEFEDANNSLRETSEYHRLEMVTEARGHIYFPKHFGKIAITSLVVISLPTFLYALSFADTKLHQDPSKATAIFFGWLVSSVILGAGVISIGHKISGTRQEKVARIEAQKLGLVPPQPH